MPSLNMEGPHKLDTTTIEARVTRVSLGNYALGCETEKTFDVAYIGRSDSDVRERLKSWVGKTKNTHFKFSYADSKKAAYEKECKNYHDFGPPLENDVHPAPPEGTNLKCPVCGR